LSQAAPLRIFMSGAGVFHNCGGVFAPTQYRSTAATAAERQRRPQPRGQPLAVHYCLFGTIVNAAR
jgi:hypothetical protein